MSPAPAAAPRPIARLQLRRVPASEARVAPPVFHVFEELYARRLRELAARPEPALSSGLTW